jgi:hypothetical protein
MKRKADLPIVFAAAALGLSIAGIALGAPQNSGSPLGCNRIGDKCSDGTIYAGRAADGRSSIYATAEDAPSLFPWNSGAIDLRTVAGAESETNGRTNTALIQALSADGQTYKAADYCSALNAYGHTDWYLPARNELNQLFSNRAAIGNFRLTVGARYWSSSEATNIFAWSQNFGTGFQSGDTKNSALRVRCIRKQITSPET